MASFNLTEGELNAAGGMATTDGGYASGYMAPPKNIPTISADLIGNTEDFTVPEPDNSTSALSRLEASVQPMEETAMDAPTGGSSEDAARPQDDIVSRILQNIETSRTKGVRTEEIMNEQQVLAKKQELDNMDKDIRSRERYFENRMRALEDKGGGLQSGLEAEMNSLRRDRARELADLYIIRAGKAQDYETAKTYAQDLIDAEFEPLQDEINNLTSVYNLMQNDLSESEKMQVQAQISEKQASVAYAQNSAQAIYDMLFQSGAATPERLGMVSKAMQEATFAIENGQNPMKAVSKMQAALSGVVSPQQQSMAMQYAQLAWQKESFYAGLAANAEKLMQEKIDAEAEVSEQNSQKVDKALTIQALVDDIRDDAGFNNAVGPNPFTRVSTPFTGAKSTTVSKINRLVGLLTIENLGALKGPASDKDVALIREASTVLENRKVSQKDYIDALNQTFEAAGRIAKTYGLTEEQASFFGYLEPAVINEANAYWNANTTPEYAQ